MTMSPEELRDSLRRAFSTDDFKLDPDAVWTQLAELGYFMIGVPEELGGLDLSNQELGIVHYELGRTLAPGSSVSQLAAIQTLCEAPDFEGRSELLEQAMSGEVVAPPVTPPGASELIVIDADAASSLMIAQDARIALFAPDEFTASRVETWDETRRLFRVSLHEGAAGKTIAEGDVAQKLKNVLLAAQLFGLAGDSLGAADAVLNLTIEYLKLRQQFDRPLASFQALKHRVGVLKVILSTAEALFWQRASEGADLEDIAALKSHCCASFKEIAEDAIQLHGGIGLTQEHPCHLFLKRAFLNLALCGSSDHWDEAAGRNAMARFAGQ